MALTAPEREPRTGADRSYAESVEDAFAVLDAAAPEGWRVELIEGEIHGVPPANGEHEEIVSEVAEQVTVSRKELRTYTGIGLKLSGTVDIAKVIPDMVIAPKRSFRDELEYHGTDAVLLIGEVTSKSTGRNDREGKLRAYAAAGIPFYLLVDRDAGQVILYSEPSKGRFTREAAVEISKTITLPEPFGFDLDTSEF
ncbi:Uma2 family endonuclease [Streptomyces sp. H10-C2]|uniref:Uma2 family endonuclease n=1 Tax=unclassified Streptomyces TaxID=2593676 RepID=UPI0024BB5C63|nr:MULTISPECIES: Uma2 family endonuclease [unclassified Streptomyces]MDJ0345350.1 Uma2 family endonuclease [Streptomyces sp. PH10-H1]MDJ0374211.1 Uma2 family endonuclease [Streptomyces sp. H10-C2]